jgi:hypothetical protein
VGVFFFFLFVWCVTIRHSRVAMRMMICCKVWGAALVLLQVVV